MKFQKDNPWPSVPPDHMLAEKKLSETITTKIFQKLLRLL